MRGDTGFFHDPSLHMLYASLAPNATHEEVEKIALEEIERVKAEGVTDGEVASAIAQILASAAYARDGSFAIASALNEYIAAGDWSLYVNEDELLKKVTAADVKRVANAYFLEDKAHDRLVHPDGCAVSRKVAAASESGRGGFRRFS